MSAQAAIGLVNPKSPDNVGAVLRAAGCYGVATIYYTGTRFARAAKYQLDTKKRSDTITLTGVSSLLPHRLPGQALICVAQYHCRRFSIRNMRFMYSARKMAPSIRPSLMRRMRWSMCRPSAA